MEIINRSINNLSENKYYQYTYFIGAFFILLFTTIYFYPIHFGHDLNFHLIRFDALAEAMRDHSFPVYIDSAGVNGYGYATKWFYSDFVLIPFAYIAQYVGVLTAYKIMIIFYTILCGWISYISIYKVFKNRYIAFIVCILYTFSYYRLYDVYNRAALGETICLTFIPLVIWGAYEIIKGDYKKWYIISIAFALMIFSHVNTPAVVAFATGIFFVLNYKTLLKEPIRLAYLALAAVVSILLTAYFVFPFVEQLLSNDFYYALTNERALSFPVMGGEPIKYIIRGLFSGMTYVVPEIAGIGLTITLYILLRVFLFRKEEIVKRGDAYLFVGIICLFIVSPLYPWRVFPFSIIGFIQFPWRFYSVATVILAVAGAVYYYQALQNEKRRYLVGIPLVLLLSILMISNSGQVFTNHRNLVKGYSRSVKGYGIMGAEYMPQNVPNVIDFFANRANDSIRYSENDTEIINFERATRQMSFDIETAKATNLELPLIYYKGYKAEWISNLLPMKIVTDLEISQSENGLIQIPVPESGNIKVYFGGTIIQNISPYITLIMVVMLTGYIIRFNRKKRENAE